MTEIEAPLQIQIPEKIPYHLINIEGYIGFLGGGKTTKCFIDSMILLQKYRKYGLKIVGNIHSKYVEYIKPMEILDFELKDCILMIDEAETIIDSRSPNEVKTLMTYFVVQTRKRRVFINYTVQMNGMIDKRLRKLAKRVWLCESIPFITSEETPPHHFIFRPFIRGMHYIKGDIQLSYEKAKPYFDLFKTDEIILPMDMLQRALIDKNVIKEQFAESPTKLVYIYTIKEIYPFLSQGLIGASYDLLKSGNAEKAQDLLQKNVVGIKDLE